MSRAVRILFASAIAISLLTVSGGALFSLVRILVARSHRVTPMTATLGDGTVEVDCPGMRQIENYPAQKRVHMTCYCPEGTR